MLNKRKLKILITRYARAIGMDRASVQRAFDKGTVHQKNRDILAMRATLYAKRVLPKNATPEQELEAIAEYAKRSDVKDKLNQAYGSIDRSGSKKEGRV